MNGLGIAALRLNFAGSVGVAAPTDALLPTSYECQDSYNCYALSGGVRRSIVSGIASTPEPAAWTLMLIGVAGLGATTRQRRGAVPI